MKYTNDYEEFAGQLSADPAGKELVDRARSGDEQALGEFVERMKTEFKPQSSTPSLADTVTVDDQFNVDSLVTHGVDIEGVGEDFVSKFPEKYANFGNQIGFGGKWTKKEAIGAWGPASAWNTKSAIWMNDHYQGGERLNNYDFIKHIQTLPRGNPERIEMEKIISGAIKEREEMEKTLGDKAIQEPGAGKVGTEVMAGIEERSQDRWRWLPQDTEQMDSRGMKGYLKVVRDNDPILTKRLSGLSDDVIMEEISKSIQEDQVMQKRMQEQLSAGRFVFEDPELYNWANRRGMVGESNVDIVGEVAKMLGSTIKGVGGMIKDSPKFFSGDQEAIDITNAGAELLIEDWDMLTDGAMRLKEKLDEKDWEDASYNPEQQKAAFDEAIEAKRQFLIRGLYNQNRWMNVSGQIAAEYATEQQAIFDKLMAFSVVFDPTNFVPVGKPASASAKAVTKGLLKGQMRKFAKLEGDVLAAQLAHGKALRFADMHKGASKGHQRVVQDRVKQTAKDLDKANSKLQNFNFDPEKAYKKMAGKLEKPQHGLRGLAMEGTGKAASKVGKVIQGTGELMGRHAKIGGGIGLLSGFASTDGDIRGAIVGAVTGHQAFRHKGIFLNKIGKKFVTAGNDISTIGKAYQLGQTNLPMHQLLLKGYDGVGHVSKATKAALSMYDPIYRSVIGRSLIEAPAKMITTPLSRGGATSAAFQAGIGYVGSGGEVEGALTGAGIGLGFASVSGGMSGFLGPWGEVILGRNKDAVLSGQARLIETIYEGQQKDGWQPSRAVSPDGDKTIMEGEEINFGEWFGSLNNTEKKIVANQLLVHPDMDIRVFKDSRPEQIGNPGSYDPETKTTFLNLANPGWKAERGEVPPAMVEFVIGHEAGHFVGNHEGMDSTIIQKLLGRPAQGIAPESPWIKRDKNGEPVIRDIRGEIVTREEAMQMDADGNPRTDVAYELSDEGKKRISQYVERMSLNWLIQTVRSPRLRRKLRHPSFLRALKDGNEKVIQSFKESAYNDPALQEYMAREVFAEQFVEYLKGDKMRTAGHDFLPTLFARVLAGFGDGFFNSKGEIQSSIFKGMKKWTGAQKLIKDYNRDVGSGKGREIEDPNRSQNFTQEEMNNTPEVVSLFDASSSVNWVESQPGVWTPEKDAKGNVKIRKPKEQKAYTQKLRETIMDWFSKNPRSGADPAEVQWRRNNDGKTVLAGRYLPDDLIKHLEDSGNFNPRQIEYIKSVNEVMKDPDNNDPILTFYQAATGRSSSGGRTYKSLAGTWRTVIPHGWEISKQDNLLLKVIEPEKLLANATTVAKSSAFKNVYKGDYQNVAVDMLKWLNNAAAGRRGAEGIGEAKRNLFRVASGMGRVMTERMDSDGNMVPVEFNELVDTLEEVSKRQGSYLMSFRTDRMNQVMPAAQNYKYRLEKAHNFDAYDRVKRNYYPGVDDARYMELAKDPDGNRDELQGLVDAAAKRAGFTEGPLFHGSHSAGITEFEPGRAGYIYFTPQKEYANDYGSNITEAFLKFDNLADLTDPNSEAYKKAVEVFNRNGGWSLNPDAMEGRSSPDFNPKTDYTWELFDNPDTDIQAEMGEYDAWKLQEREGIISYAIADPNQIKSADPVTYDDSGNVIPLSERFNLQSDDIRFSPGIQDGILFPNGEFVYSNLNHGETFAGWLRRNPDHPFAKKIKGDKSDHYGVLDEAVKHGLVRVVSGVNYGTKNVELEISKPMTSVQKAFLEERAIEAGQKVTYFDLQKKRFETFYEPPAGGDIRYSPGVGERIPELEDAAKKLQSGSLSKEEYSNLVDKYKPVHPYTSVPQPATMEEMRWALNSNQLKKLGKGYEISEGQDVGLRLDINAYTRKGVWIPTIHHKSGKTIAHESVAMLTDGVFPDSGEKALRVAVGANKAPFAVIKGKWKPITPDQAESIAQTALSDDSWIQVGFDPTRHSYFYDRKNHRSQVVSADEVIQIGPLVLAKNAQTKALTNQSSDIRFSPGSSQNTVDGNYQRLVESINAYTNPNLARRGIKGRKDSLGDELRAQAKGRTSEVQRDYTKQAAKRSGLTIPYQDLVQRINRSGLEAYLKSPSVRAGDITRLRQLLGVNDGFYLDSSTISDSLLNAANPDGDLYFLGSGIESLAFRDISDGKVLKLRQTKTGDTHKFGLDVDVGSNGQVRIIMGDDFGAVQTINDFSGAFDTRYELEGFTDGMEYMLLKQDFIKPARDTKTSDIANYMLDNGWVIKVAPTTENIGGHQDVNQYFWFNRDKQLVATDAHVGNFHVDQNNNVFPIDLPTRKLTTQETAKVDMYYHPGVDEDGIVSQENMPGYNSGILRGLHSAAPSEKMAFHKALQKALHYKKGDQLINIIAEEMGVDASEMATGISAYLNSKAFLEMNPATQVTGFPSLEMAELYALLHGYFTYQEAVSAYKPEYGLKAGGDWGDPSILTDFILRDKNGNPVKATAAQVKKIHKIIEANTSHMPPGEFGDPQAGDIAYFLTDNGFRLMFLDLPSNPDMNLQIFADIISDVTESLKIDEDDFGETTTNSIYQENKWGLPSSGSGEAYRAEITDKATKAGQPDLLGRLERRLGPILQPVYDKFAKKGLGNPGTQPGVVREVAGVTLPRTMSQLSDADALTIANKVAPVKRGEDPYSAIEAREIVEDYMAWDKLSATEGDQFMGELKRVAGVNQKQLMDAKRKGKESVGQLKEKQVPAKAEMEGIPRKNQSVVFKNNDKVHFGIPKVSDVKYAIKWDKNKGKDGAFVVGASHMAKSDVFPNIVLDGELGKAIEKPDHHASVFEATKKLNELVSGDPEKATSKQGYLEFMKKVGASSNALVVPSTLEVALTNPKLMADMILGDRLHGKRKIETRQNALDGLDGTLEFREAIGEGQAPDNRVTALLHLWGILSRMLPPLDQEGLWLRMMANRDVLEAVHKSTEGKFNLSEAKWKKIVAESRDMTDKNAAKIGNNATSNANSFHAALKLLNGKWDELGKSFATNDHSVMRQQYWDVVAKRGSLGIKNKVLSFMGLTTGIPTWVGDRWQYVFANLPTLERMTGKESASMFTYDRYNTPEDPTGIYSIYGTLESDNPVFSNLLYEYINTSLQNAFEANPKEYKEMLGDHVNASGFHWVTWNAIKNEPVGHSSLSILLKLQKESGNIKTLDDFINLVMNEKTYTEGRKSGKNFRLIFDKGTITHDSTIVKD